MLLKFSISFYLLFDLFAAMVSIYFNLTVFLICKIKVKQDDPNELGAKLMRAELMGDEVCMHLFSFFYTEILMPIQYLIGISQIVESTPRSSP